MQALQCFKCLAAKKMFFYETAAGATQIATNKIATTSARFIGWNFGKASPLPANYICNRPLKSHHFVTLVQPLSAAMAANLAGKAVKAKGAGEPKSGKAEKKVKDPNEPKRPVSSYFIFMETFRKTFKKENPDVTGVVEVTKAAGAKWKEMTAKEKKPYTEEQEKRKVEYDAKMEAYLGKMPQGVKGEHEGTDATH